MNGISPARWVRIRVIAVVVVIGLLLGGVLMKAHSLVADEGGRLREMASQQYLKDVRLPPRRGTIYDRHGVPLAVSAEVPSVYANPREVGPASYETATLLAPVLEMPVPELRARLSGRRYFSWLKRRISPREAKAVRALRLRGIHLTKESRRFFPNHRLGATSIGFAGMDARGLEGIERALDDWLRGEPTTVPGIRDAMGRPLLHQGINADPATGHDVQLSLDRYVQYETEQALVEAQKGVRPKTGWVAALVLDTQNGDVLALGSEPSFDPNQYEKASSEDRRNHGAVDAFEPGSMIKVFTVAEALQQGTVRATDRFSCENGNYKVGHYRIHDSHRYGTLSVSECIKKSSNICMAKIAFRLGKERLHAGLKRFGFGAKTGVQLPGERGGVLRSPRSWSDVGLANISFGQGLTTTVLQLGQALTALANDGVMMRPRLVTRILRADGTTAREFAPSGSRVVAPWVARSVLEMMTSVVEKDGTGELARMERYQVAGKTATAQKVDRVTGTYSDEHFVSSFFGVVPASRPRLAIVVVINEPAGDKHFGGEVAGPVFKRIAEKALSYLGVPPDRRGSPVNEVAQAPAGEEVPVEGHVATEAQEPAPPLPGNGESPAMVQVPDFTGMSMAEVLKAGRKRGLLLELLGTGVAVGQSPGPGPAAAATICRVSFRPPA